MARRRREKGVFTCFLPHKEAHSALPGTTATFYQPSPEPWRGEVALAWEPLRGGSLTPLDPHHHTGGLYFAWLRLNFFRALRAPVFSYIRGLSNVEREV